MTTKPIVVVDLDGVLADFVSGFTEMLYQRPRSNGTQKTWQFDASPTQIARAWAWIDESKKFWYSLVPLVTESEVTDAQYLAPKVNFVYMTGREDRSNDTLGQTERWLRFVGMPSGTIILEGDKAAGVSRLDGDVLCAIEDRPRNINRLWHGGTHVFVRDWLYNRALGTCSMYSDDDVTTCYEAPRVTSFGEFILRAEGLLATLK